MTLRLPGRWDELTSREFAALDPEGTVAILPVGAIEQHGPHLPVAVDTCLNEAIVRRGLELMPAGLPALVLPTMAVGKSNEHVDFPGTLTLSAETLGRVWYEIGASVRRAGVRKLLLFNSHGGQPQVMQIVARELRVDHDMLVVAANWYSWGLPERPVRGRRAAPRHPCGGDRDLDDAGGTAGSGRSRRRGRLHPGDRGGRCRVPPAACAGRCRAGLAGPGPARRRRLRRRHARDRGGRSGRDRARGGALCRAACRSWYSSRCIGCGGGRRPSRSGSAARRSTTNSREQRTMASSSSIRIWATIAVSACPSWRAAPARADMSLADAYKVIAEQAAGRPDPQLRRHDAGLGGLRPGDDEGRRRSQDARALHDREGRLPRHILFDGRPVRDACRPAGAFRPDGITMDKIPLQADDPAAGGARRHALLAADPNHAFSVDDLKAWEKDAWRGAQGRVRGAAHRHVQGLGQRPGAVQAPARSPPGRSRRSSSCSSSAA